MSSHYNDPYDENGNYDPSGRRFIKPDRFGRRRDQFGGDPSIFQSLIGYVLFFVAVYIVLQIFVWIVD